MPTPLAIGMWTCFSEDACLIVCLFVCMFVCLLTWLIVCMFVCLFAFLYVCLLICFFIWLLVCLLAYFISTALLAWLLVCLFACLIAWLLVCLFACSFQTLSVQTPDPRLFRTQTLSVQSQTLSDPVSPDPSRPRLFIYVRFIPPEFFTCTMQLTSLQPQLLRSIFAQLNQDIVFLQSCCGWMVFVTLFKRGVYGFLQELWRRPEQRLQYILTRSSESRILIITTN